MVEEYTNSDKITVTTNAAGAQVENEADFFEETSEEVPVSSEELVLSSEELPVDVGDPSIVPNNVIEEFEVPDVRWNDNQIRTFSMPYYMNESLLGSSSSDSQYDARNDDIVTSVKNQGSYGTCWAFAAIGAMEANILLNYSSVNKNTLDLSEYQLAYFTYHGARDPMNMVTSDTTSINSTTSNYLAYGGDSKMAALTLMSWKGTVNEVKAPYSSARPTSVLNQSLSYSEDEYHVSDFYLASMTDRNTVKK